MQPSVAGDSRDHRQNLTPIVEAVHGNVFAEWTAVDCARETAAGAALASAENRPRGAQADGTVGLQSAVPVVRGSQYGRRSMGRDSVHQESGAIAESRRGSEIL